MGFLNLFKRKEVPLSNVERIEHLLSHGRITDGVIIDTETTPAGDEIVFFVYTLNGVDFESSELLDEERRRDPLQYAAGAKVGVLYDPKNQGNSTLV
ncbi:MAG: hypothetical protein WKF92_12530 [Pyrinomonadaceae bacterium]